MAKSGFYDNNKYCVDHPQYWLTRLWLQRSIGFTYFIAFLIVINQWRGLVGEKGLLPTPLFLERAEFWDSPSLFFLHYSDLFAMVLGILGLVLSVLAMTGVSEAHGVFLSMTVWASLWVIYLSFVNAGQTFYGFGWETLLLEAGFLTIFLGPARAPPSVILIWLFRWLAFRVMFGAGMIKIRGDECWRNLTCMQYHYETQPLPNPLSWFYHQLPAGFHRLEVAFTHFVELVVPFLFFAPHPFRTFAGLVTIAFQTALIFSGNLSWLNYITIFVTFSTLDDAIFARIYSLIPAFSSAIIGTPSPIGRGIPDPVIWGLGLLVGGLSIRPAMNLFSNNQLMNASFEPLHLVNTYGAFGSITRDRYEVILEGTQDRIITSATRWKEYEFKGKPGRIDRRPPIVSPYHWKLDWQMWFAAMSPYQYHSWILNLIAKLLQNDPQIIGLMDTNPFPEKPPHWIRAELYHYHFTRWGEKNWWKRERVEVYLPPLNLSHPGFREVLKDRGWIN